MLLRDEAVELLRVIAHPQRMALLRAMSQGERGVGELATLTGIGQPALSQQLGVLRCANLVEARRQAKQVFYSIRADSMLAVRGVIDALIPALKIDQTAA